MIWIARLELVKNWRHIKKLCFIVRFPFFFSMNGASYSFSKEQPKNITHRGFGRIPAARIRHHMNRLRWESKESYFKRWESMLPFPKYSNLHIRQRLIMALPNTRWITFTLAS